MYCVKTQPFRPLVQVNMPRLLWKGCVCHSCTQEDCRMCVSCIVTHRKQRCRLKKRCQARIAVDVLLQLHKEKGAP